MTKLAGACLRKLMNCSLVHFICRPSAPMKSPQDDPSQSDKSDNKPQASTGGDFEEDRIELV